MEIMEEMQLPVSMMKEEIDDDEIKIEMVEVSDPTVDENIDNNEDPIDEPELAQIKYEIDDSNEPLDLHFEREDPHLESDMVITVKLPQSFMKFDDELLEDNPQYAMSDVPAKKQKPDKTVLEMELHYMEKAYNDSQKRANEKHELELRILRQKLREYKAKADIAYLNLRKKHLEDDVPTTTTTQNSIRFVLAEHMY